MGTIKDDMTERLEENKMDSAIIITSVPSKTAEIMQAIELAGKFMKIKLDA